MITNEKLKEWELLIKECESSGMKVSVWCNTKNLDRRKYYYIRKKVRENTKSNFSNFIKINKTIKKEVSDTIELKYSNGASILIDDNTDLDLLKKLNELLSNA
jgi:hypothetical protein